jgi:hypothetical protein
MGLRIRLARYGRKVSALDDVLACTAFFVHLTAAGLTYNVGQLAISC